MSKILEIKDLRVEFRKKSLAGLFGGKGNSTVTAVNGVSFSLDRGDTLGLVGESGCGKSTLARAVMRLTEPAGGEVHFEGTDLLQLGPQAMFKMRRRMQMVFQDPVGSLNPRYSVGSTLSEVFRVHNVCAESEIEDHVRRLMTSVGLTPDLIDRKPAELSGGQCQRVGIARALALSPNLIIADEAVAALDVSIQAQILNLLTVLQKDMDLTLLFISHDLGVVRHLCKNLAVMYLGQIVEFGPTQEIFDDPQHPYTKALIAAIPSMDPDVQLGARGLSGEPPNPSDLPPGCSFNPRCNAALPACRINPAPPEYVFGDRRVRCHLAGPKG